MNSIKHRIHYVNDTGKRFVEKKFFRTEDPLIITWTNKNTNYIYIFFYFCECPPVRTTLPENFIYAIPHQSTCSSSVVQLSRNRLFYSFFFSHCIRFFFVTQFSMWILIRFNEDNRRKIFVLWDLIIFIKWLIGLNKKGNNWHGIYYTTRRMYA